LKIKDRVFKEVETLSMLKNPNIIKLEDFYEDYNKYLILLEKANGGDLLNLVIKNKRVGFHIFIFFLAF
jgi:serine/threonine protein kinase